MKAITNVEIIYNYYLNKDIKDLKIYMLKLQKKYACSEKELIDVLLNYLILNHKEQERSKFLKKYFLMLGSDKEKSLDIGDMKSIFDKFLKLPESSANIYIYELTKETGYSYNELMNMLNGISLLYGVSNQKIYNKKISILKYFGEVKNLTGLDFFNDIKEASLTGDDEALSFIYPLLCVDELEAKEIIETSRINRETYYTYLSHFINIYHNQVNILLYLKNVYDKCNLLVPREFFTNDELLDDILSSGYCPLEYASIYGLSLTKVNQVLKNRRIDLSSNPEVIKSQERIDKKLESIAKRIIIGDYDIVDYFLDIKLPLDSFNIVIKSFDFLKNKESKQKITDFINRSKTISFQSINKELELNSVTTINGMQITRETKEIVFNFIDDNNLPKYLYRMVLKKYVDGKLVIDGTKRKMINY